MITKELLNEIGILDIGLILEQDKIYRERIIPLAKEYNKTLGHDPFMPHKSNEEYAACHALAAKYVQSVAQLDEGNGYMLQLLAWLHLVPYLKERYRELGIDEEIFRSTMKDLSYKIEECKQVYGVCGVFTDFFFQNFNLKLFQLGRLQFQAYWYPDIPYTFGDIKIKEGDTVYFCHIPSSGRLSPELCMDSLDRAYEFFKDKLNSAILPVYCTSWLLYEPYYRKIFPKGSNLSEFAKLFDVYKNDESDFTACWRIFGKRYENTTEGLPADTSLRRSFIEYIKGGGSFGNGSGFLLYDGERKKIINKKQ